MEFITILFWVALGIVFYTYIGYGIILAICVRVKKLFSKQAERTPIVDYPDVTICISGYNELNWIEKKTQNCRELIYPADKLHIVWVTDGSTDESPQRLREMPGVTVYHKPERRGKTAAVNRIIPFIDTPIVVFTDANTLLNKEALQEIVYLFQDPKVGCVAGEKRVNKPENDGNNEAAAGEGLYWKYESQLKKWDYELYTAVGAAGELYAVRRELYEEQPTNTLLDDFMISMRIAQKGYKIAYSPNAYAFETGSADFEEEAKRKRRISAGGIQSVGRLLPLLNPFKYPILSFQYISHRVLRWTITPFLLFALIPLNILLFAHTYNPVYGILLLGQIAFYALAYLAYRKLKKGGKSGFLFIYYFVFMNYNVFRGIKYLVKEQNNGVWEKAKRA